MNKIIAILIILLLLAGNIFLGIKYYSTSVQLQKVSATVKINGNILNFNKLFVQIVLKSQGEISIEDRLKMENAAVDTNDKAVIDAWHSFLDSATEADAQQRVLVLLSIFPDKIVSKI